jgi:hypothetical protein
MAEDDGALLAGQGVRGIERNEDRSGKIFMKIRTTNATPGYFDLNPAGLRGGGRGTFSTRMSFFPCQTAARIVSLIEVPSFGCRFSRTLCTLTYRVGCEALAVTMPQVPA